MKSYEKIARAYFKNSDVYELDQDLIEEIAEEEKELSLEEQKKLEDHVDMVKRKFRKLSRGPVLDVWELIKDDYSDKDNLKREFAKRIRNIDEVESFILEYLGDRVGMFSRKLRDIRMESDYREKDALKSVERIAKKEFISDELEREQENIREEIPEEIRQWLPESIVIEVDEDGQIERISNMYKEQRETVRKKIAMTNYVVKEYNRIAREVKEDLKKSSGKKRLAALVMSIIMETGIRPGSMGNATVEVVDGDKIEVETFGAVTLQPHHVDFIRKDFARLEFRGKKGGKNIAEMSDQEVLSILKSVVEQARDEDLEYIFVTKEGQRLTYNDVRKYKREKDWSHIRMTDFRKRKGTLETLRELHGDLKDMYEDINQLVEQEVDGLKEKVTERVSDTIETALREAQDALSHKDVSTTISSYVNPEVVLRFLSRGEIEDNLQEALITNERHLEFDPDLFIEKAREKTSSSRIFTAFGRIKTAEEVTLKGVMEGLEEDMENFTEIDPSDL